jgi:acid stress-induced BolA-like protein IbaG/YrbA
MRAAKTIHALKYKGFRRPGYDDWISAPRWNNLHHDVDRGVQLLTFEAAMRPGPVVALFLLTALAGADPARAQGFKFSQPTAEDKAEQAAQAERAERIAEQLSTPCRADLKGRKIMVIIGEVQGNGYVSAQQQNYGPHFQAINGRLRSLGLATYTPEEIKKQIAQAEIDAYFRNDPDAALAAAKRLGASFVLRGLISSEASVNPVIAVNQISVTMGFTLAGSNGRTISDAQARSSSYAGADVARMALTLVNEQADEVVATLYADYCRNAGLAAPKTTAPKKPAGK